jgi:putative addiction module component (TIGR02574 family)
MSVKEIIESAKKLNPNDRAFVARCLISSLETTQDEGVDQAWAKLAEKRYAQLLNGEVNAVPWEEIKKNIKG